ncbi:MAG: AraC family transcriptional regulator [Rariglobus sp.]|jgi:AraC-like DNA-binding protein|nr:AraC family transcriptional regulator [Rariglobus sp.]
MLRYRLHTTPSQVMPLNVRSAGHYQLAPHRHEPRGPGDFLQVFWSIGGSGSFTARGTTHAVKPGVLFYYAAGEPHDLLAGPEGWDYRWLTFDGGRHRTLPALYSLARIQFAGPCPAHLFEQLDACLQDPTSNGELRASVLGYEILLLASCRQTDNPPPGPGLDTAAQAKAWIDLHFTDARLNVAALTARLGVHRATLHRVFTSRYGVSPVQYLGRLRLRLALDLLTSTRLPVADVAIRAGLPDLAYFSKLITRHTTYSPRAYRQRHAHTAPAV